MRRPVCEDILLGGMSMKIQEHFNFFGIFALKFPDKVDDCRHFRKHLILFGIFLHIPIPIKIMPQHAGPIIAHLDPININHGHHHPHHIPSKVPPAHLM